MLLQRGAVVRVCDNAGVFRRRFCWAAAATPRQRAL